MALISQVTALFLLLGGVSLGWHLWARPYSAAMDMQARGMLLLAILAIVGGFVGGPFWWLNYPDSFSWQLPPLAGRLLASAGFAFAVTGSYLLQRKQTHLVPNYICLLAVYLAPLVVAILLFHLDRFDWRAPITYAFFLVAAGMALASIWHLARGTTLPRRHEKDLGSPVPCLARCYLATVAVLVGLWGYFLFVWPSGPLPELWLWTADPLTSRLIGTMLMTIATAAVLGTENVGAAKMSLVFNISYGLSVTAAGVWNLASGRPIPLVYVLAFSSLALTSLMVATSFSSRYVDRRSPRKRA